MYPNSIQNQLSGHVVHISRDTLQRCWNWAVCTGPASESMYSYRLSKAQEPGLEMTDWK